MSDEFKRKFLRFLKVMLSAMLASFVTMMAVQYFMGGIRDIAEALGKSFMIGFGLAFIVVVIPKRQKKYPWQ